MLYFFILPVYLIFLGTISIVSIVLIFKPPLKHLGIYGLGISIGSIPGLVIANILLWLVTLSLVYIHLPDWLQSIQKFITAGMVILGPVPVSIIGIMAGSITGFYIVYRKLSKKSHSSCVIK